MEDFRGYLRDGVLMLGLLLVFYLFRGANAELRETGEMITAQHYYEPAPGINLEIMDVTIPESTRQPIVTFSLTDDNGNGLDPARLVHLRFTIAWLSLDPNTGLSYYTNYLVKEVTDTFTGSAIEQPTFDSGGTILSVDQEAGLFQYVFGTSLPADYHRDLPHTVGGEARRVYQEKTYDANATYDFVPAGGELPFRREIVNTNNCNECHGLLAVHDRMRREYHYCQLCHTPQNIDPVSGNSLDLKVMIHKIHRGRDLPSVQAGNPYRLGEEDFSQVEFPQDIRNCTKCHRNADQAANFKERPSREACGSCMMMWISPPGRIILEVYAPTKNADSVTQQREKSLAFQWLVLIPYRKSPVNW